MCSPQPPREMISFSSLWDLMSSKSLDDNCPPHAGSPQESKQDATQTFSLISTAFDESDYTASEVGSDSSPLTAASATVRFRIEARDFISGAAAAFRDVHVDFEEDRLSIMAFASGSWKIRLPFQIRAEESRFSIIKTGKFICITLHKARLEDDWSGWAPTTSKDDTSGEKSEQSEGNQPALGLGRAFL